MDNDLQQHSPHRFDLSYASIMRVILVLAALVFLYTIRDIVAIIFVAIFLSAAITPWVNWFHVRKIPRALAVLIIYIIALAISSLVIALVIPPLIEQVNQLSGSLPTFLQSVLTGLAEINQGTAVTDVQQSLQGVQSTLAIASEGVFKTLSSIFGGLIFFGAVMVLTFYMVLNEKLLYRFVQIVTPKNYQEYAAKFIGRAQDKLGKWLRGQLLLMLFVAVLTYIGLVLLGVEFALVLALLAGLFELIPMVGPILSAIPALIIALSISPTLAVFVLILYIIVQQVENHILVPKVMQKAVGLNPIVIIVAILIGLKLAGVIGAIIAVPATTMIYMFVTDMYDKKHEQVEEA